MVENPIYNPVAQEFWAAGVGADSEGYYPIYDRYQEGDIDEHLFKYRAGVGKMDAVGEDDLEVYTPI